MNSICCHSLTDSFVKDFS